jgi:hypothetical protein
VLSFDLYVNHTPIGRFEAIRRTNVESRPSADDVSTYEVRFENLEQGHHWELNVDHRYGDGALALVHKALGKLIADD